MLRSLLLGTPGRMKRVGEQQEACGQVRFFGAEHARLASAVGMAPEEYGSGFALAFGKIPTSRNTGEKWGTHNSANCCDGVL